MREIEASVYATPCQGVADLFEGPAFDTGAGAVGWGAADPRERVLGSRGPPDTLDPTAPPVWGSREQRVVAPDHRCPRRELGSDQSVSVPDSHPWGRCRTVPFLSSPRTSCSASWPDRRGARQPSAPVASSEPGRGPIPIKLQLPPQGVWGWIQ